MTGILAPGARKGALRTIGFIIAVLSVIVPALPFGAWVAQPPLPLAVLWAAYGWAADDGGSWRRPAVLAVLGLVHDQLAGGPYGLFVSLYLVAFLIGRVMANIMSSPNLISLWGGFAATAAGVSVAAFVLTRLALGPGASIAPFIQAAIVTVLLFPFVRAFYMSAAPVSRASRVRRLRPMGASAP